MKAIWLPINRWIKKWCVGMCICCCSIDKSCPTFLWPHRLQHTSLLCPRDFTGNQYWSRLPFPSPGDLPRDQTLISCIGRQVLYHWTTQGSPCVCVYYAIIWLTPAIKNWNLVICDNMDRKTNTVWFHLYVESRKQNKWINITEQKHSYSYREQSGSCQRQGEERNNEGN